MKSCGTVLKLGESCSYKFIYSHLSFISEQVAADPARCRIASPRRAADSRQVLGSRINIGIKKADRDVADAYPFTMQDNLAGGGNCRIGATNARGKSLCSWPELTTDPPLTRRASKREESATEETAAPETLAHAVRRSHRSAWSGILCLYL